jgi:predicted DNA-binding antitoxin AbrB/MazE fold protein
MFDCMLRGGQAMSLEAEATYENGVLKLDKPLPLGERERVTVHITPQVGHIRQSAGLIPWKADLNALEHLLGADNHPWEGP